MGADRRREIRMTDEEQRAFLRPTGKVALSTVNQDGCIHTVALFYGFLGDDMAFLAKSKSQKVVNLRRDPRLTCMREDGDDYYELRGVTLMGVGEVRDDRGVLWEVGEYLYRQRHRSGRADPPNLDEIIEKSIYNRAVIVMHPKRVISWDHRKLQS